MKEIFIPVKRMKNEQIFKTDLGIMPRSLCLNIYWQRLIYVALISAFFDGSIKLRGPLGNGTR